MLSSSFFFPILSSLFVDVLTIIVQILNYLTEGLLCLLVQVGDCDSSSQDSIIRMSGGLVSSSLCSQVVQLYGGDSFVDSINDLMMSQEIESERRRGQNEWIEERREGKDWKRGKFDSDVQTTRPDVIRGRISLEFE